MTKLSVSLPLLALALCAGCAMDRPSTGAMGASSASSQRTLYCKDGAYVTKEMGCAAGVERVLPAPASGYR